MVGEGFFGSSVGLPSKAELLHSFFSVAVVVEFSIMFCRLSKSGEAAHMLTLGVCFLQWKKNIFGIFGVSSLNKLRVGC